MTSRLLITGGTVLAGAPMHGEFRRADLLAEAGRIVGIGTFPPVTDAEMVDATGMLVLPGFVDAHAHLWEASMRGITAEWDLLDFLYGIRFHHASLHTPDDVYAGALAGALASLDAGTTTVLDHMHLPAHAEPGLRAVRDAGIRAVWASAPAAVRAAAAGGLTTDAGGLVTLAVAADEIGNAPWATTRAEYLFARERDLPLTAHLETIWGPVRAPEIEWLHRDGLLGPRQVFSHVNAASEDALRLLADHGAAVVSTPDTELQMGIGHPVLGRAAALGVPAALGSDIQANNGPDLFAAMRLARQAENGRAQRAVLDADGTGGLAGVPMSTREVLHAATLGGARALGLDHLAGSLEPGKQADVVLLRVDGIRHRPLTDPFATVVLHAGPGDVDSVFVAGRAVKRAGVLDGARRATGLVEAAWARLAERMDAAGGRHPHRPADLIARVVAQAAANAPAWA
ncbi:amidohydrolase family protein [Catenuloplanes atrovinosus]|uniref:Cytosine/adenosine deaminase-related metal-dependent hydrolase n=1 Tax=Catenuloplanes atrovinosus TaxID=137266 RepID=A0AAE3YPX3_9ACTN|nr:amidohydrolase family protein [Catenuloplanes atrovinosus]MDR7276421.1 cytosine/adenosine deaminase-related metal-dependent hydrolase [Catenuloplanes atrovinosus]